MELFVSPGTTPYFICGNFIRLFMFHFIWANLSPSQLACWALRNRFIWSLTAAWQTWLVPFQCWMILPHLLPFWSLSTLSYITGQLWISEGLTESPLIFTGEKKCLQLHYLSSFSKKTPFSIPVFANGYSELILEHMYFIPKLNPVVWASLVRDPFTNKVFFPVSVNCRFSSLCELHKGLLSTAKGRHLCRQAFRPAAFRTHCRHSFTVPVYINNVQEGCFLMRSFDWVSKFEHGWKCYKILLKIYGL